MVLTFQQIQEQIPPIAKKYNLPAMYLFGSYARGQATESSDIDFLIDTTGTELTTLMKLAALYVDLEAAFHKQIDLITLSSFSQPAQFPSDLAFREEVMRERKCLYTVSPEPQR